MDQLTHARCRGESYVARDAPWKSYFLSTVKDAKPVCADGKTGGARMPFGKDPLPADEIACLEAYVQAVAK